MDIVLEDVMRKFQADRGLSDLTREQMFETFAAYCVVGQFYEDDFEPQTSGSRSRLDVKGTGRPMWMLGKVNSDICGQWSV
jgi:hypothetical protein